MNTIYGYDAFGRRIEKDVDGTITKYLYDGDQVICEYDASDILQAKYIYGAGIDEPILMERGGATYYYHFDGLGSVTALSDSLGDLTEGYEYDIFGSVTSSFSGVGNPYYFTGRRYDPETGLYYYRARYYSPKIGRFLQADPIGYVAGINLYTYVGNNPMKWTDPFGYCREREWYEGRIATGVFATLDIWAGLGETALGASLVPLGPVGAAGGAMIFTLGIITIDEARIHLEGALTGDVSKMDYDSFEATLGKEFGSATKWVKSTHTVIKGYKVLRHPVTSGGKAVLKAGTDIFRYIMKVKKESKTNSVIVR